MRSSRSWSRDPAPSPGPRTSEPRQRQATPGRDPMRQRLMFATMIAALAAVAIGCGSDPAAPGTTPDQPLGVDRLQVQAQAALDRWAAAAKAANNPDVGIIG